MFNVKVLGTLFQGALESAAQKHMQEQQQPTRKVAKVGCTPCEAIARVEAEKKRLGFRR